MTCAKVTSPSRGTRPDGADDDINSPGASSLDHGGDVEASGADQPIERQAVAAQECLHDRRPIARAAGVGEDEVTVGAEARQQRVFGRRTAAAEALEPELRAVDAEEAIVLRVVQEHGRLDV